MCKFKSSDCVVNYEESRVIPHTNGIGWDVLIRMELLETLSDYIMRKGSFSELETIKLGMTMCRALALCHTNEVVHRDIKPQNIFVDSNGNFKLGDFGIAKKMDHETIATKIGTYQYIAPEVFRCEKYDFQADIYSLGLVLYWVLNERRLPFLPMPPELPTAQDKENAQARRFSGETIPMPKNCSAALKSLVLLTCNFDPKKRFGGMGNHRESASVMENALKQCIDSESSSRIVLESSNPQSNNFACGGVDKANGYNSASGNIGTPLSSFQNQKAKAHFSGFGNYKYLNFLCKFGIIAFAILIIANGIFSFTGQSHTLIYDLDCYQTEFYWNYPEMESLDMMYGFLSVLCGIFFIISWQKIKKAKKRALGFYRFTQIFTVCVNAVAIIDYVINIPIYRSMAIGYEWIDVGICEIIGAVIAVCALIALIRETKYFKDKKQMFCN